MSAGTSDPGGDTPPPGPQATLRPEVPPPPPPRTGQTTAVGGGTKLFGDGSASDDNDAAGPDTGRAAPAGGPGRHGPGRRGRPPLRYRILPRTAIGISFSILMFSFGASLSGVALYAYYEHRLTQNEDRVSTLTNGLPAQVQKATASLKQQTSDAQNLINSQLAPLRSVLASGQTVQDLEAKAAPALYFVHTLDQSGQPSVGSAFAVASDSHQTLLLTSYTVVAAATRQPGPQVFVRHGSTDQPLTVYTWDETKDLALLIMPTGSQPTLTFAATAPQTGERVFALSGLGAQGASITQGFVADVSATGIQHDATTGTQFQGGPLLDSNGQVVGILSRTYAPLGFPVADVWFAVPPSAACAKVLVCAGGSPTGGVTPGATGA